eukprot:1158077-Pelagomonas_calceolata.AAC.5
MRRTAAALLSFAEGDSRLFEPMSLLLLNRVESVLLAYACSFSSLVTLQHEHQFGIKQRSWVNVGFSGLKESLRTRMPFEVGNV